MSPTEARPTDPAPADREAADWFTRLGARSVTTEALREFRAWRRTPANDAAYRRLERTWSRTGQLRDDPDIQAALREARGRATPARPGHRRRLWGAGLAAAAVAIATAVMVGDPFSPAYATQVGEQRMIPLPDGSRMRLNTDSRVRLAFRGDERRVRLMRGQAFFEVAHDAARPFVVEAGDTDVRALGTRFDVRRDGAAVRVLLVEGSVRVRRDDRPEAWTLRPDEELTLTRASATRTAAIDTARATSWTSGRLVFRDTPLQAAVAEVNRYARHPVELQAAALAGRRVNGDFEAGDTQAFVQAVATLFDLRPETRPDGSVRLRARGEAGG